MKTRSSPDGLEERATEALRVLLGQVSTIKVKSIQHKARRSVLAQVNVLGHDYTLACKVRGTARPGGLRNALRNLHDGAAGRNGATPVVIAPYLPPEAQALCKECHASFLDLEGNARMELGEVFIGKRAMHHHAAAAAAPSILSEAPIIQAHAA